MINSLTSVTTIETVLMKLTLKQKLFIYQIARLDYRIFKSLLKLEEVEILITEEEKNLRSVNAAIEAAGEGKIKDKLLVWKTKTEYKLFKLNLRKNKIDVVKLVLNQSKLEQLKQALSALNTDMIKIEGQMKNLIIMDNNKEITPSNALINWNKMKEMDDQNPVNQSIKIVLQQHFKMAS